jgi:adenylyltransferase/sulfurtransferase
MQRYIQQMIVPEIGTEGQKRIGAAKVLIIGAGGLGIPLTTYLSSAGIGSIGIMDGDRVSASNLSRQFLYTEKEIGLLKVDLLAAKFLEQNPLVSINAHADMLTEENAYHYINPYDIICDCTDNAHARVAIDKTCGRLKKPLIYAVVRGWEGYVTVLHHTKEITLENIFSYQLLIDNETLNCSVTGIVNATCGIAGSIQAAEVMKIILGLPSRLDGGILTFNASDPVFRIFELK